LDFPFDKLFLAFAVLVYIDVYIKLVVVVNEGSAVDKTVFFHKINHLGLVELAGQTLYPSWTKAGQKRACSQEGRFCTSHPVDMQ
jgi:hypothetical protein